MAEGVAAGTLREAGLQDGDLHRTLEHRLVQVMAPALAGLALDVETRGGGHPPPGPLAARRGAAAPPLAGLALDVEPRGGEHPLPAPLAAGVGALARQRAR